MALKCLFFGQLSDELGCRSITVESISTRFSISSLIDVIALEQSADFAAKLVRDSITVAVDQVVEHDHQRLFDDVSEVAFFPPVTGG